MDWGHDSGHMELAELLVEAGISQTELARRLSLHQTSVNKWRSGGLPVRRLPAIAKATGIPLDRLLPPDFRDTAA